MPTPNHLLLATGATAAVSVAVATALALYENPELRRYADDVRRRIAIALHSIGDGINPPHREPLFNRPEDAHGFMQSSANPGVDADEETRRRQREELLYWNSIRLQKEQEKKEQDVDEKRSVPTSPKTEKTGTFDDFLHQDSDAEKGAYVFNSGAQVKPEDEGLRHRGFAAANYSNPFADEHHIGDDDMNEAIANSLVTAAAETAGEDAVSDIYSATTAERSVDRLEAIPEPSEPSLIDADEHTPPASVSSATVDFESAASEPEVSEAEYEFMTAGQDDRNMHASIQAWAHQQHSNPQFYEPLPSTPAAPQSEPELVSDGQLTPTDSMSIVGSDEAQSTTGFDVISESDGMNTPADWSEVGSMVSESDAPVPAHAS